MREQPPPAEFTIVLNAIRDGSLVPMLNDVGLAAALVPSGMDQLVREVALLVVMLNGLEHRERDAELEARIRARIARCPWRCSSRDLL